MSHAFRLAAALAAWPALAFAQGAPAPLTAETMWQLKRLGTPAISPDGIGPERRRWRISRRVGSARALKTESGEAMGSHRRFGY